MGAWTVCRFKGGGGWGSLAKRERVVFFREVGVIPQCTLCGGENTRFFLLQNLMIKTSDKNLLQFAAFGKWLLLFLVLLI